MCTKKINSHLGNVFDINEAAQAHGIEMRHQFYFVVSRNPDYAITPKRVESKGTWHTGRDGLH
jgi:hypothetical protein